MLNTIQKSLGQKAEYGIGFRHFIVSVGLMFLFSILYTTLIINGAEFLGDIFGFYFATELQSLAFVAVLTVLGVGLGSLIVLKSVKGKELNASKIVLVSTACYVLVNLAISLSLFFGDQTASYGITPREDLYATLPATLFSILVYYTLSRYILNRK